MGLFLALAGAVFIVVLWTAWQRAEETRRWTPVPCRIVSSKIVSSRPSPNANVEHRVIVAYLYVFQGKEYSGSRIKRVDAPTVHIERARKKLEAYPAGLQTTCHMNPAQPDQAVLQHDTRTALYSIWFPLLFVIGGLGMTWNAVRRR